MKLYEIATIIIGSSLAIWFGYGLIFEGNIETPKYQTISKQFGYEIRQYKKINTISVNEASTNNAFRQLFKMIDGNNSQNKKIPMTAPVIQTNQTMTFVLPNSMIDIPTPTNPNVTVSSMGPITVAVKKFRGSAKNASKYLEQLKSELTKKNLQFTDNWYLCQYNSPWVFPLLRKNEIWVTLD